MKAKKTWGFGSKSFQGTDAKIASCKKSRLANFASGSMHSSISMFRIFSYKKNLLQLEKKSGTLGFFVTRSLKGLNAGYSVYIESDDDAELIGMFSMLPCCMKRSGRQQIPFVAAFLRRVDPSMPFIFSRLLHSRRSTNLSLEWEGYSKSQGEKVFRYVLPMDPKTWSCMFLIECTKQYF